MLSESELRRYSRQLHLDDGIKIDQERLKNSRVLIAGAGGLGSPVSMYLAAAGVGTLVICDNDEVELSNLNRQLLHGTAGIGRPKTDSAAERLRGINPEISIITFNTDISDSIEEAAANCDLIIDCLDNIATRYVINGYCMKHGVPLLHGGVRGLAGQVSMLMPPETACLRCIFPEDIGNKNPIPILGSTAGITGSIQATEAVKYLCTKKSSLKNRLLIFDGTEWEFTSIELSKNPACPACGKSGN